MHCYAHNLNRVLVNAASDMTNSEVRNFFGVVELIFTFVGGSAARHAFFIECPTILFVCLFVGFLTALQRRKAISATHTIHYTIINRYIQNASNILQLFDE